MTMLVTIGACAALGALVGAALPAVVAWAARPDEVSGSRALLVPATALLFAVIGWRVEVGAPLAIFLYLAAVGVALVVIDIAVHRLPDALTLPSYPVVAALLGAAAVAAGDTEPLVRAGLGGSLLFAAYYLVAFAVPGAMGFGDVKLAGLLGLVLGWAGWAPLVLGAFLGFLYGGAFSLALIAARRASRRSRVAFGPFMIAGALTAVCLGQATSAGYLGFALM